MWWKLDRVWKDVLNIIRIIKHHKDSKYNSDIRGEKSNLEKPTGSKPKGKVHLQLELKE